MKALSRQETSVELSVVLPAMNEEECIASSLKIICDILEKEKVQYELIVVNDGSTDNTLEMALNMKGTLPKVRVISSRINQGHMNAITEGMRSSKGNYICTIDADLQDPPEAIPEMLRIIKKSEKKTGLMIDVVQTYRNDRNSDSIFKRFTASAYYRILKKVTGVDIVRNAADFRLMRKSVMNELLDLPEKNKVYRLLIPSLGFNVQYLEVPRRARTSGATKYTIKRMLDLTIDSVIAFSNRPLRFIANFGIAASLLLFSSALLSFVLWAYSKTIPGWTSLVLLILSSNALIFASIGIVGEYVGRIYVQNQRRPTGIWREI